MIYSCIHTLGSAQLYFFYIFNLKFIFKALQVFPRAKRLLRWRYEFHLCTVYRAYFINVISSKNLLYKFNLMTNGVSTSLPFKMHCKGVSLFSIMRICIKEFKYTNRRFARVIVITFVQLSY